MKGAVLPGGDIRPIAWIKANPPMLSLSDFRLARPPIRPHVGADQHHGCRGRLLVGPRQLVTDHELYPDWVQAFIDRVFARHSRGRFENPRPQIPTGIVVNIKFCGLQRRIHVLGHLYKLLGSSLIFVPLHKLGSSPSLEAFHLTQRLESDQVPIEFL